MLKNVENEEKRIRSIQLLGKCFPFLMFGRSHKCKIDIHNPLYTYPCIRAPCFKISSFKKNVEIDFTY